MKRSLCLAAAMAALFVAPAFAQDAVKTAQATRGGKILEISPTEVTLEPVGKPEEKIPVNEIIDIRYSKEPFQLSQLRLAVRSGRHDDAVELLKKIDVDTIDRDETKADFQFYRALLAARMALNGAMKLETAITMMTAFYNDYPTNMHYFEANEVLGDLLVAAKKYDAAVEYYARVEEKAPWPDYKMRAGIAKARALQVQGKHAEAMEMYDAVLEQAKGAEGDLVKQQQFVAAAGKAACLAETGKADDGLAMAQKVVDLADAELTEVHALAYNALGNCYAKLDKKKEARLAFLHTHLLYSTAPDAHAEALAKLAVLWKDLGDVERADEAQSLLKERYGNSRWAARTQ